MTAPTPAPGILFVVSTPIGNLEDVTLRALRVLRQVSVVAAEDTRRTAGLLAHYDIHTPLESLHEHNEAARVPTLLARLAAGESIALVSDAGTPLVSDPGSSLVAAALDAGHRVEAVPGPSAVLAALVTSGLPAADGFSFLGFAPSRDAERRRWLQAAGAEPRPAVFFEAPHRVRATLDAIATLLGEDRFVIVSRELTKLHETHLRGPVGSVLARIGEPRGEYTVVLAPARHEPPAPLTDAAAWEEFAHLTGPGGLPRRDAVSAIARRHGVPARDVYAAIERAKPLGADKKERP
jgi:16S rRNA (cytidine1402-2'-O)-methyltransferase